MVGRTLVDQLLDKLLSCRICTCSSRIGQACQVFEVLTTLYYIPRTMTRSTTPRLRQVKTLLNLVDSLTPMLRMKVRTSVMPRAHKSGYSLRYGTSMGRYL